MWAEPLHVGLGTGRVELAPVARVSVYTDPPPSPVAQSWDIFFRNANAGAPPGAAYQSPPPLGVSLSGLVQAQSLVGAQPNVEKLVEDHLAVQTLIRAYQVSAAPPTPPGARPQACCTQILPLACERLYIW